jgi:hypothetical protein
MKPVQAQAAATQSDQPPPLDPAVIKLVDALAREQAKEDHQRETCPDQQTLPT